MSLPQSQNPYFDDFDQTKNFYSVLFQPSKSVQVRELNQLQTILQDQISKFGDNIFKTGSIITGCHITYHNPLPYVKIRDQETNGNSVVVSNYENKYIKNETGLTAIIGKTVGGFELKAPDLNTLYVNYTNSGNSGSESTFLANQTLTIYDPTSPLTKINIINGSSNFSNTDSVLILSAIAVQNTLSGNAFSNGFFVGDYISNGLGANVKITSVTGNATHKILSYTPKVTDLATANAPAWSLAANNTIVDANTGETANVALLVGSGATAKITTDFVGKISTIQIFSQGNGYSVSPTVVLSSTTANTTQITSANLVAQPYYAQVTVANTLLVPVGNGYGLTVSEGVIYQKGYFQRVPKQLVIVDKYSSTPDQIVVGFDTREDIITSNIDQSLLDNSLGTPNSNAPGADRLKLTPTLTALDKQVAAANSEFLPIVEFAQGLPFSQNIQTQYNIIEKELAQRTYEEAGNFVLDQFNLTTKSPPAFSDEANSFSIVIDPGLAYINGYRVETVSNYNLNVAKGTDITSSNASSISMNFGNYIRVSNVGGSFDISSGLQVGLYTAKGNFSGRSSITEPAGKIGNARIRSMVLENAQTGTYRVYLFGVSMNAGYNFKDVRSIFTTSKVNSIADVVLNAANNCVLYDNNLSSLVFPTGVQAINTVNNVTYIYKESDTTRTANTLGLATKTLSGSGKTFPYTGQLSSSQEQDLIITPLANLVSNAAYTGTFTCNTTSAVVTGSGTTFTSLNTGDFIQIANTTANSYGRIISISNDTFMTLDANSSVSLSGNGYAYFPQNVPISFSPATRTVNVSANGTLLTVNLGTSLVAGANVSLTYNVRYANVAVSSKTTNRSVYVRLNMANNVGGINGPWSLGLSDIFRLRNVYKGSNNTFLANSTGVTDVTQYFFIDHNQNQDYYNVGYLYKDPTSTYTVSSSDVYLVKFDCFTGSEGLFHVGAYPVNDTVPFANATTTVNTLEIPEVFGSKDDYYDLRDCVDFRPITVNTAVITTNAATATINPTEPTGNTRFASSTKLFPSPDSTLTLDLNYYNGRIENVAITDSGKFRITQSANTTDSILISTVNIPPYPSLPTFLSLDTAKYLYTGISNGKATTKRANTYTITYAFSNTQLTQPRGYTMKDIGELERRISDIEYYVSLTLQENDAKNKVIPSASNSALDRFKFGFFVDSFKDSQYSETSDPAFNCAFSNGFMVPNSTQTLVKFIPLDDGASQFSGSTYNLPYEEYTIASQLQATETLPATSNTISNTVANTITCGQKITVVQVDNQNFLANKSGLVYEVSEFKMSNTNGPVTVYFNFHDNRTGIDIFQGTESGFDISTMTPLYDAFDAVAVNTSEQQLYLSGTGAGQFENLSGVGYEAGNPALEDTGKISFNHNPDNGVYYKIKITKYRTSGKATKGEFHYKIHYPIDDCTPTDQTLVPPPRFTYTGTVVSVTPPTFNGLTETHAQSFNIKVSGLKPLTPHTFTFNNADYTAYCLQDGQQLGAGLTSDASGLLSFTFYYRNAYIQNGGGDYVSAKSFLVENTDGTSTAYGTIGVKNYTRWTLDKYNR